MNSIGHIFRVSLFGESHGKGIGVVVDGVPAGIEMEEACFTPDLSRRRSGAYGTTTRKELDKPNILSGLYKGYTTGAPIAVLFENQNVEHADYSHFSEVPRPGHADFTALAKFHGFADIRGGGHFSGRLTLALVTAGVIAKKIISPIDVKATLVEAGGDSNYEDAIKKAVESGDSVGGIIQCVASNMPIGLGEPFFESVESAISKFIFSIPAVKGIAFGAGFESARMRGSQHNDVFVSTQGKTDTNHSGGILGGISNGNNLEFRIAVKPTSSIAKAQSTINLATGVTDTLQVQGRHDACIALRVPVVAEAATAIALADLLLLHRSTKSIL